MLWSFLGLILALCAGYLLGRRAERERRDGLSWQLRTLHELEAERLFREAGCAPREVPEVLRRRSW